MKTILLLVLSIFATKSYSQQNNLFDTVAVDTGLHVTKFAEYPGGQEKLYNFIKRNLEYPIEAASNAIQGRIYARFVVCENGDICNVTYTGSEDQSLRNATTKLLKKMPKWIPAERDGEKVKMQYVLPVSFRLE